MGIGHGAPIKVGIVTPIRLLGEGVALSLGRCSRSVLSQVAPDLSSLTPLVSGGLIEVVIIDVAIETDLDRIREFHDVFSSIHLLALGLREDAAEIVQHGRAGFCGYIAREDGADELCRKFESIIVGRLECPPHIASALMRSLFDPRAKAAERRIFDLNSLTPRERLVAHFVSRGLSNKEVALELDLSESTVKHHVHSLFGKMQVVRRSQIGRMIRGEILHVPTRHTRSNGSSVAEVEVDDRV